LRRVAAAAELPVVLYLRNAAMGAARIAELVAVDGVVAVKWATPQPLLMAETMRLSAGARIAWICGLAEPWAPPLYSLGARGFTSGLINVAPERSVAIHTRLEAGDYAAAQAMIDAIAPFEALRAQEEAGANVSVVKAALRLIGHDVGPARPPAAWPLAPPAEQELQQLLAQWDLCDARPDDLRELAS
jgi:4-hydroxy-tetrahydrodipicolinate synthase